MHAQMVDGDKNAAFKVFQSMLSAGIDARRGWLLLCKDYFHFGCVIVLRGSFLHGSALQVVSPCICFT